MRTNEGMKIAKYAPMTGGGIIVTNTRGRRAEGSTGQLILVDDAGEGEKWEDGEAFVGEQVRDAHVVEQDAADQEQPSTALKLVMSAPAKLVCRGRRPVD